jgi:alkanesulfonate monooxygenase SsuD/methylene tetrahydromethanopterin reductase-like flavin-dependent oxidoreductase (luciferase family)
VGVGWLREEAEAMGMPWDRRGARSEEHIALMRTLWCADGDLVEFHGEFHDLPPMDPEPRPVQRPIPILIGGHSDIALERAGRIGDGWIAAQMSPERVLEHWPRVLESAERNGRDPASVQLFTSTPVRKDRPLGELLADYREIGVDHVQVGLHRDSREETLDTMRDVAENVIPTVRG